LDQTPNPSPSNRQTKSPGDPTLIRRDAEAKSPALPLEEDIDAVYRLIDEAGPNEEVAASFFGIDVIGAALAEIKFDGAELTRRLVALARDPDPKVSQKAISQLIVLMKTVASFNGLLGSARMEKVIHGKADTTRKVVSTQRLINRTGRAPAAPPSVRPGRAHYGADFNQPDPTPPPARNPQQTGGGPSGDDAERHAAAEDAVDRAEGDGTDRQADA
jgi:hypothetical protein